MCCGQILYNALKGQVNHEPQGGKIIKERGDGSREQVENENTDVGVGKEMG